MDCTQARELIDDSGPDAALAAHVAGCPDCRELNALIASLAQLGEAEPPAGFQARLRTSLARADRRRGRRGARLAVLAAGCAAALILVRLSARPHASPPLAAAAAAGPAHDAGVRQRAAAQATPAAASSPQDAPLPAPRGVPATPPAPQFAAQIAAGTAVPRVSPGDVPRVFRTVAATASKLGVALYVPTVLPPDPLPHGAWSVVDYALARTGYHFSLVWTDRARRPGGYTGGVPGGGSVFTLSTPSGPFPAYPTETELLGRPSGTLTVAGGVVVRSYGQGAMVRWPEGGWSYTAVGTAPHTAAAMARGVLAGLGETPAVVPGTRGALRVSSVGGATFTAVSWTFDGRRWFTASGRSGARGMIAELRSLVEVAPPSAARASPPTGP